MTEADWLACIDPDQMLAFLRGKASNRKLRLFICACCRHIWHLLNDERSRKAVDTAECYADGLASKGTLKASQSAALAAKRANPTIPSGPAAAAAWFATCGTSSLAWTWSAMTARMTASPENSPRREGKGSDRSVWLPLWITGLPEGILAPELGGEAAAQCALLLDLFGNPLHPVIMASSILVWNDGVVVRLAQAIYEERSLPAGTLDNTRLAILADALEEAGCTDGDILNHCRQPGEHARGCWVVDLILGKS